MVCVKARQKEDTMFDINVTFEQRDYKIRFDNIRNEDGIFIYWGTIYFGKTTGFSCIRIDDGALFLTQPITEDKAFEEALLNSITAAEMQERIRDAV